MRRKKEIETGSGQPVQSFWGGFGYGYGYGYGYG